MIKNEIIIKKYTNWNYKLTYKINKKSMYEIYIYDLRDIRVFTYFAKKVKPQNYKFNTSYMFHKVSPKYKTCIDNNIKLPNDISQIINEKLFKIIFLTTIFIIFIIINLFNI